MGASAGVGSVGAVTEPLRDHALARPHPARFDPGAPGYDAALRAHDAAVQAGQAGYLDPGSGLFVMTAAYLIDRGSCCHSGCRHCPYLGATRSATGTGCGSTGPC